MSLISPFATKLRVEDLKKLDSASFTYRTCVNIQETVEAQVAELQRNVSRQIRSDAGRAIEYKIKFDQDFLRCSFEEKMAEFYKSTMRFFDKMHSPIRVVAAGAFADSFKVIVVPVHNDRLDARFFCSKTSLHKLHEDFYKKVSSKFGLSRSMKDVLRHQYGFFEKILKISEDTNDVAFVIPEKIKGHFGIGGETADQYIDRFILANDKILRLARSASSLTKMCQELERECDRLKADNIALHNILLIDEEADCLEIEELFNKRKVKGKIT